MSAATHLFDLGAEAVAVTTDDWYTPRWIFDAAGIKFTMDVAAPIDPTMRTVPAWRHLTILDDGLVTPWEGTVWCNPPYSKAAPWVDKWASHDHGMLLLPAVPEVKWLGVVLNRSDVFTMLAVDFHRPDGGSARLRWPSILAARGSCAEAVASVAAADKYAAGGHLRGASTLAPTSPAPVPSPTADEHDDRPGERPPSPLGRSSSQT